MSAPGGPRTYARPAIGAFEMHLYRRIHDHEPGNQCAKRASRRSRIEPRVPFKQKHLRHDGAYAHALLLRYLTDLRVACR